MHPHRSHLKEDNLCCDVPALQLYYMSAYCLADDIWDVTCDIFILLPQTLFVQKKKIVNWCLWKLFQMSSPGRDSIHLSTWRDFKQIHHTCSVWLGQSKSGSLKWRGRIIEPPLRLLLSPKPPEFGRDFISSLLGQSSLR